MFWGDNDAVPADRQPVRFGIFEVDLTEGELRRKGERVKLQEQPFQVLAACLKRPVGSSPRNNSKSVFGKTIRSSTSTAA